MSNFINKVALITGAGSGIGAGTAKHFACLGCKLALTDRNGLNLKKVADDCKAGAPACNILEVIGDVSKEDDVKNIIIATVNHFGRIDILVNSAGILQAGSLENTALENYNQILNTNTRSVFLITQLTIPYLKVTKGNIVNVSSMAGLRSYPNVMAYCMSKAAVDQLTKCSALELAAYGVRVNSVNPGVIPTEIHKVGDMSEEEYSKFLERCKKTHALGRAGTLDEVAKAIAFLADENTGSFITGVNLPVDGGRGVMCPR